MINLQYTQKVTSSHMGMDPTYDHEDVWTFTVSGLKDLLCLAQKVYTAVHFFDYEGQLKSSTAVLLDNYNHEMETYKDSINNWRQLGFKRCFATKPVKPRWEPEATFAELRRKVQIVQELQTIVGVFQDKDYEHTIAVYQGINRYPMAYHLMCAPNPAAFFEIIK